MRVGEEHVARVGRWAGPLVLAALLASAATVAVAARPSAPTASGAAARFVPVDGAITSEVETGAGGEHIERITQHGRIDAYAVLSAVPAVVEHALASLENQGSDVGRTEFWVRTTQELVDGELGDETHVLSILDERGVSDLLVYGGRVGFAFDPPLLTLPASARPGDTWAQDGDALPHGSMTYHAEGAVVAPADGSSGDVGDDCVATDAAIELREAGSTEPLITFRTVTTWCAAAGIVRAEGTLSSGGFVEADPAQTPVRLVDLVATRRPLRAPAVGIPAVGERAELSATPAEVRAPDPVFGDGALLGTASFEPVAIGDRGLAIVQDGSNDLVALRVTPDGALEERWRRHPGGDVLTVAAVSGLLVTTSANRLVTGYDLDGIPRWTTTLADAVVGGSASAGTTVVLATISGDVVGLDPATGEQRWRAREPAPVLLPMRSTGPLAIVATPDGLVARGADGSIAWTWSGESVAFDAREGLVAVVDGRGTLHQLDGTSGRERAQTRLAGVAAQVSVGADVVVAITDEETAAVDASGARRWSTGPSADVIEVAGGTVVRRAGGLDLFADDGARARSWAYDKRDHTDPTLAMARDWLVPVDAARIAVFDRNLLVVLLGAR